MGEHPDNLERLIVRSLDGELSDEQQLELDRALMRNPEARRMMDDYRAVDVLVEASLSAMADEPRVATPLRSAAVRGVDARALRIRAVWLVPGAIAAALLALVIARPAADQLAFPVPDALPKAVWPAHESGMVQPVSSRPSVRRATGRDLVGVVGDDGNIYWIEVERTRTVRLPYGTSGGLANRF